jgi:hypothetical protein
VYLETLAELGPLGLGLLLTALGVPLVASWRARRHPLMAGVLAAYVAFLVHAAADWDWQLAAVGLAGLACGATLLVMARGSRARDVGTHGRAALARLPRHSRVSRCVTAWRYPLGQARSAVDNGQWVAAQNRARKMRAHRWILGSARSCSARRDGPRAECRTHPTPRRVRRDPSGKPGATRRVSCGADRAPR